MPRPRRRCSPHGREQGPLPRGPLLHRLASEPRSWGGGAQLGWRARVGVEAPSPGALLAQPRRARGRRRPPWGSAPLPHQPQRPRPISRLWPQPPPAAHQATSPQGLQPPPLPSEPRAMEFPCRRRPYPGRRQQCGPAWARAQPLLRPRRSCAGPPGPARGRAGRRRRCLSLRGGLRSMPRRLCPRPPRAGAARGARCPRRLRPSPLGSEPRSVQSPCRCRPYPSAPSTARGRSSPARPGQGCPAGANAQAGQRRGRCYAGKPLAMQGLCRRPTPSAPGTMKGLARPLALQRPLCRCADQPLPARSRAEGGRRRLSLGGVRPSLRRFWPRPPGAGAGAAAGTVKGGSEGCRARPQAAGSSWASGSSRRLLQLPGAGPPSGPAGRRHRSPCGRQRVAGTQCEAHPATDRVSGASRSRGCSPSRTRSRTHPRPRPDGPGCPDCPSCSGRGWPRRVRQRALLPMSPGDRGHSPRLLGALPGALEPGAARARGPRAAQPRCCSAGGPSC
jgi:hypothetical protein